MLIEVKGKAQCNNRAISLRNTHEDIIYPHECRLFGTGVAVSINNQHIVGFLLPVRYELVNAIGVIDSDFQGEVKAGIINRSRDPFIIRSHSHVGELYFMPMYRIDDGDIEITPINPQKPQTLPSYATEGAAALDIFANISIPLTFYPNETLNLATGFTLTIKRPDVIGMILPRSSLSVKHGICLADTVSILQGTTPEVVVKLINHGRIPYTVNPGERIAQLLFLPIILPQFITTTEFTAKTTRSNDGFGSTGK